MPSKVSLGGGVASGDFRWYAIAFGVLDVQGSEAVGAEVGLFVLPTQPDEPLALWGMGENLWRRMIAEPIADSDLTDGEKEVVAEMAARGLASMNAEHPARVFSIDRPWMVSPLHELVCALVQSVAQSLGIRLVIIKGPMLHRQGVRAKEHSGDVDVWVEPTEAQRFSRALEQWGWTGTPLEFAPAMYHSLTMKPGSWGCEIDVHYRFPGAVGGRSDAFDFLFENSDLALFAGVPAQVPALEAHTVLHALHLVRPNPLATVGDSARSQAVSALRTAGTGVIGMVEDFGAMPILRTCLVAAFPEEHLPPARGEVPEDWLMRDAHTVAGYHRRSIRLLPWRSRPRAVWAVIWPSEAAARLSVERRGGTAHSALSARLKRLLYGAADLLRGGTRAHGV